jgi:hypothetical protein
MTEATPNRNSQRGREESIYELNRGTFRVDEIIANLTQDLPVEEASRVSQHADAFFYSSNDRLLQYVGASLLNNQSGDLALYDAMNFLPLPSAPTREEFVKTTTRDPHMMEILAVMLKKYLNDPYGQHAYAGTLGVALSEFPLSEMSESLSKEAVAIPEKDYKQRLFGWLGGEGSCWMAEDRFVSAFSRGNVSYDGYGLVQKGVGVNSFYALRSFRTNSGVVISGNYYLSLADVSFWSNDLKRGLTPAAGQTLALLRPYDASNGRESLPRESFDVLVEGAVVDIMSEAADQVQAASFVSFPASDLVQSTYAQNL